MLISAYFDESSESDAKNGLLSVSGYALDIAGLDQLIPEWQEMLRKYRLPYFYMSYCNSCTGIFSHLNEDECDQCARMAIRIARAHPLHGYSYVLDQSEYRAILQDHGFDRDPYSFMVYTAFVHVNRWVHENRPDHKIALFFERGYQTQKRANALLQAVTQDKWRGKNRVESHSFVDKECSPEPTQAADLIAWHVRKGYENLRNGKAIRRDTLALIENKHTYTIEWTADRLRSIAAAFVQKTGSLENAARTIFSRPDLAPDDEAP